MGISWIIIASVILLPAGLHAEISGTMNADQQAFCSKGWYTFGELCYKGFPEGSRSDREFLDNLQNFEDASKKCVGLGGQLATISSQEVQNFVVAHILLRMENGAYIGLRHNESDFATQYWADGSIAHFKTWDRNEPSTKAPGGEVELCVEMVFVGDPNRIGKWNDIACDRRLPYVCQKEKGSDGAVPEKEPQICSWSTDGIYFRKSCFHFSSHWKTWENAEQYCKDQYNGHLASVTDIAVQIFLSYNMGKLKPDFRRMWIGIRLKPDDVSLWSSGWYVGYRNWETPPPPKTNTPSGLCGLMEKATENSYGKWFTASCEDSFPFICENSSVVPPPRLNATKTGLFCPPEENDWIDLGGDYCYIIGVPYFVSWYHANFICMTKGGTLASVHSDAELLILEQFVRFSENEIYIGLFRDNRTHPNKDPEFIWADHSDIDFTKWRYGEPNNKDEMCVEAMIRNEMRWNDIKCDNTRGFICSVPKVELKVIEGIQKTITKQKHDKTVEMNCTDGNKKTLNKQKEDKCVEMNCTDGNKKTLNKQKEDKCECLPTPAIVGVVACVVLVIVLIAVVLYNVKPWKKSQPDTSQRKSSVVNEKPRYRTGQRAVSEQIYENMDTY